jgi:hypothetical protein
MIQTPRKWHARQEAMWFFFRGKFEGTNTRGMLLFMWLLLHSQ